jgi:hypothetical protein
MLALPLPIASFVIAGFAALGIGLAFVWRYVAMVPHGLDMAFGMLTLGNLGMLAGWWADNRFVPLPADAGACCCASSVDAAFARPGMWLGMLVAANLAMLTLGRRPCPREGHCRTAMFTGGNVGMLAGMFLGGVAADGAGCDGTTPAVLTGLVGMTIGMFAGMQLGAALTRKLLVRLWPGD